MAPIAILSFHYILFGLNHTTMFCAVVDNQIITGSRPSSLGWYMKNQTHTWALGGTAKWEDPRVFNMNGTIHLFGQRRRNSMFHGTLTPNHRNVKGSVLQLNGNSTVTKNWVPFVNDNKLFVGWRLHPLVLLECHDYNCVGDIPEIDQASLIIRGGTQIIRYRDKAFTFAHSRIWCRSRMLHRIVLVVYEPNPWRTQFISTPININNTNTIEDPVSIYNVDPRTDTVKISVNVNDKKCVLVALKNVLRTVLQNNGHTNIEPALKEDCNRWR